MFSLAASGLRWTVDNLVGDQAVGATPSRPGTLVCLEVRRASATRLDEVFSQFTDEDQSFTKSKVTIKLYGYGVRFISRSEAKRVGRGLERFRVVELDFTGVEEVGQGFVDELLRVWPSGHPTTRLEPTNMSPAVAAMVNRGLPRT
ncbi:MAG: STAS-like domain-containing protein [Egibacteraceae bacterium]